MSSSPRDNATGSLNGSHGKKFLFSCDDVSDDDEILGMRALQRATREEHEEIDVVEKTLQETLEDSLAINNECEKDTQAPQEQQYEEPNELFVAAEEDEPPVTSPPVNDVQVKSEPDDDDCCMVIDQDQASADAQEKWAKPRLATIDLTPGIPANIEKEVKKEPLGPHVFENSPAASTGLQDTDDRRVELESKEKRKAELEANALRGPMIPDDLAELLSLTAELNNAKNSAHGASVVNTKPSKGKASNKKSTTQGNKRHFMTKEEYWAKVAERERKVKQQLVEKKRKRNGSDKGGTLKKSKTSDSSAARQENGANADEEELDQNKGVARQIAEMLLPLDFILQRANQGGQPAQPDIRATRREQQLRQMRDAAPGEFAKELLEKQAKELEDATKGWGPWGVRAKDGKWEIRRVLTTPLHNHQIIVGAWMMGRELKKIPNLPRGGMLADAMGLGKTIETLSCISGNPSPENLKEKGQGATLVVCPSEQMIGVWISEVKKHCSKRFARDMVRYKRQNKMDLDLLGSFNIVLATYHQVRASTPSAKEREAKLTEIVDVDKYNEWLEEQTGDLHRIKWYRVVLDEAHSIKNHLTHGKPLRALACSELKSTYRWVVSGTPLINSDTEFFSYFKFLRCRHSDRFSDWGAEYHGGVKAKAKLNSMVSNIMFRRTQNDWFLGQRILNLPATIPTHQNLQLSQEEGVIFKMMERCFRRKLNSDLQKGDGFAERQVRQYLVILLRLRQAATHPFLLEGMMDEYFTFDDLQITKDRLAALKGKRTVYEQIGSWADRHQMKNDRRKEVIAESERIWKEGALLPSYGTLKADGHVTDSESNGGLDASSPKGSRKSSAKKKAIVIDGDEDEVDSQDDVELDADGMVPEEYLMEDNDDPPSKPSPQEIPPLVPFGKSEFGLHFDMDKQIDYLIRQEELYQSSCAICKRQPPQMPLKGKCGCIFCDRCLMCHTTTNGNVCPSCERTVGKPKTINPFHGGDSDDEVDTLSNGSPHQRKKNDKDYEYGFDYNGFQHREDDKKSKTPIRFLQISDKKTNAPVTPSAKMTALKETILRWQREAPDDKIIVFSQFNLVMKIVARMLEGERIPYNYLSGKQSTEQREKAVQDFQEGDVVKVLIVSLRAGGQCLNLTRGNRVILMELWWNHAVEQQAFSRVFRIGQIKETHFVRFIVDTPVEKRMLTMQVDKILRIDAALQDEGVRTPKVGLEDIASLLGKVVRHDDGVMQVVADYSDGEDDEDDPLMPGSRAARRDAEEEKDLEDFVVPDDEVEYEGDSESDIGLSNDEDSD